MGATARSEVHPDGPDRTADAPEGTPADDAPAGADATDRRGGEFDDPDVPLAGATDGVARDGIDPMPLVVGAFVAVAGLLLLVQPVVPTVSVFGTPIPPFALAPAPLSVGFAVGTVGFARRGKRLAALAHGVGAVGFGLLFLATGPGGVLALWLGLAVVLGGVAFLVVEARRR